MPYIVFDTNRSEPRERRSVVNVMAWRRWWGKGAGNIHVATAVVVACFFTNKYNTCTFVYNIQNSDCSATLAECCQLPGVEEMGGTGLSTPIIV